MSVPSSRRAPRRAAVVPASRARSPRPARARVRVAALSAVLALLAASPAPAAAPVRVRVAISDTQSAARGLALAPLGAREAPGAIPLAATVAVPPAQQRIVAAPVAGLLDRVAVAPNDPVRAGQPIGRLTSPALVEMQRDLAQAAVRARLADDTAVRDRRLFDEGLVAESRLRASLAHQAEAVAELAERRQALKLAGLPDAAIGRVAAGGTAGASIDLVAPIDGVVLDQPVQIGSRVEAATALFRIARIPPLWLELQVPVRLLARVAPGDVVEVPSAGARGTVASIGRGAGAGQMVPVRVEVGASGAGTLVPGQAVEALLRPTGRAAGWRVPPSAVVRHDGVARVFAAVPGGFDAVEVRVIDEGDAGVLVDGPLDDATRVVVRGAAALKARLAGIGGA